MTRTRKNLKEQEEQQQTKPTGTGGVGREKIDALTNAMQQMQGVLSVGTGGSTPGQAAASPEKARDTGDTAAAQEPEATKKKGSKPSSGKQTETQKQIKQSVNQPESVEGFVELDKDATAPVLDHLSKKFGVQSNDLKKLSMTRGVRILFDPQYLKVQ